MTFLICAIQTFCLSWKLVQWTWARFPNWYYLIVTLHAQSILGGGLASIFKQNYCCWKLTTDVYLSFELKLFVLELDNPMAISVIYPHKDFIIEFSDILGGIIPILTDQPILGSHSLYSAFTWPINMWLCNRWPCYFWSPVLGTLLKVKKVISYSYKLLLIKY